MKRKITLLTLVLMLIASISALAWDVNKQSVRELTVGSIKNSSGTTIGVSTTGSSVTVTGTVQGRKGKFVNTTTTGANYGNTVGNVTGTVTGHSTLDLPLTGGTMTGAIKAKVPGNAFTSYSATAGYISGAMTAGSITVNGHAFTTMTTTINGVLRNLLKY